LESNAKVFSLNGVEAAGVEKTERIHQVEVGLKSQIDLGSFQISFQKDNLFQSLTELNLFGPVKADNLVHALRLRPHGTGVRTATTSLH